MNRYKFEKEAHVHSLDQKRLYGTTTILDVLGKSLTWWSSGLAVAELGWLNPKLHTPEERMDASQIGHATILNMTPKEFQALLDKAYRAHKTTLDKKADDGTDLHHELSVYVQSQIDGVPFGQSTCSPKYWDKVHQFIEWSKVNVREFILSEAHCYSERLWVGGQFDLLYIDNQGRMMLGDFKSAKDCYFSQFVQLGGYDIQLSENGALDKDGNMLYRPPTPSIQGHAVFFFGAKTFEPAISFNTARNKRAFESCVSLYKDRESWNQEFGRES